MNKDQVKGAAKDIGGKIQEEAGKLVGSTSQQAKGLQNQAESAQGRQQCLGDLHQTHDVHLVHRPPLRRVGRLHRSGPIGAAGVVHQHLDDVAGGHAQFLHRCQIGDVADDRDATDLLGECFDALGTASSAHHAVSLLSQGRQLMRQTVRQLLWQPSTRDGRNNRRGPGGCGCGGGAPRT